MLSLGVVHADAGTDNAQTQDAPDKKKKKQDELNKVVDGLGAVGVVSAGVSAGVLGTAGVVKTGKKFINRRRGQEYQRQAAETVLAGAKKKNQPGPSAKHDKKSSIFNDQHSAPSRTSKAIDFIPDPPSGRRNPAKKPLDQTSGVEMGRKPRVRLHRQSSHRAPPPSEQFAEKIQEREHIVKFKLRR
jgi:hypothetical protein